MTGKRSRTELPAAPPIISTASDDGGVGATGRAMAARSTDDDVAPVRTMRLLTETWYVAPLTTPVSVIDVPVVEDDDVTHCGAPVDRSTWEMSTS